LTGLLLRKSYHLEAVYDLRLKKLVLNMARLFLLLSLALAPFCSIAYTFEEMKNVPEEMAYSSLAGEMAIALKAAKEAGTLLLSLRQEVMDQTAMEGRVPDSTTADIGSNELIYGILHKAFPEDGYFSQEGIPGKGPTFENAKRYWLVDPLDGTTSYAEGKVTGFCIIITLVDESGVPVLNATHFPSYPRLDTTTTFFALKGYGAFKQEGENAPKKLTSKMTADKIVSYSSTWTSLITKFYTQVGILKEDLVKSASCGQRIALLADSDTKANLYLTSCLPTTCGKIAENARISFTNTWDIGGIVILEEIGGVIKLIDPRDQIEWLNPHGVIYPHDGHENVLVATSDPSIFDVVSQALD
jgi:3'-phosphoadenosine 5'-phosphosulfate (PAPS) 3'-phosphatase